jgi:hypothetical protein
MAFEDDGYVTVRGLLDQSLTELIFQYVLLKHKTGMMSEPDDLIQNAPHLYADPLTESLMLLGQPKVERLVGGNLLPSYSYARLHGPGNTMPIHQDRDASEVGVSICVGGDAPWPLWFRTPTADVAINLEPGDGIVYYGQRLPHWREPFTGSVQVQCVLFYVRRDGTCAEHAFDGRSGIGRSPHKRRYIIRPQGKSQLAPHNRLLGL